MSDSPHIEETSPLLAGSESGFGSSSLEDAHTVDSENADPDNPLEWSDSYKWWIVILLSFMGFIVTFTCISIAPIAGYIISDLDGGTGAKSATILLVTIWELGEAVGPLFIAPLSEKFGRCRLYLIMNTMFLATTISAALSPTTELLITSRALTGVSVACNVLNPAIIGDMFMPEERGTAISLIMFIPLTGGTVGPVLSGIILEQVGWRTLIWSSVGMAAVCQLLFCTFLRETYRPRILRKDTGLNQKPPRGKEDVTSLRESVMRPLIVLLHSGVLVALVLFGSFIFSHFYIVSTSLPGIVQEIYGLSPSETGLIFIANLVGTIVSFVISKHSLDRIYVKLRALNGGKGLPEYRLPLSIIGALILPLAVMLYGWCAQHKLPLGVFIFSMILIRTSMMLASSPLMAYMVDACGLYSASAMAGLISIRCLAGSLLPLSISDLTEQLGYARGFFVFGCVGLVFALVPIVIFCHGARWRQRSRYTKST